MLEPIPESTHPLPLNNILKGGIINLEAQPKNRKKCFKRVTHIS